MRDRVPGAAGQPHHAYPDANHFIQEDEGPDLARRVVAFVEANPLP
jgi:haloalkane dehalogenase